MKKIACALILVSALLTGCGTIHVDPNKLPPMGADVAIKCEPLPDFTGKNMGDLLDETDRLAGLYEECATRDAAKADWVLKVSGKAAALPPKPATSSHTE
jgi:hypothetical protein